MRKVKTHTGIVITRDGEKKVKLHETPTTWCVGRYESYDKVTGFRCGAAPGRNRLVLGSVVRIEEEV